VETEVVGATTQGQRPPLYPPLLPQRPTTTTKDDTKTYYILAGTIGNVKYTLKGGPGVPIGTFRAKITNGLYSDILVTGTDGSTYNVGFKIIGQEKISSAALPQTSAHTLYNTADGKPIAQKADDNPITVFYWANELNAICQMESPIEAGVQLPALTTEFIKSDVMRKFLEFKTDQGVCVGYILGRSEALTEMNNPGVVHAIEKVCFPLHNPGDELVASVKEKLAKETTLHDKQVTASIAVDLALKELFPCPTK